MQTQKIDIPKEQLDQHLRGVRLKIVNTEDQIARLSKELRYLKVVEVELYFGCFAWGGGTGPSSARGYLEKLNRRGSSE